MFDDEDSSEGEEWDREWADPGRDRFMAVGLDVGGASNRLYGSDSTEQTIDPTLPMQHSYLGSDLKVFQGRTLLSDDEGSSHWLPLLDSIDIVIVPGQTLPLAINDPVTMQMINRALGSNRTFGAVCKMYSNTSYEPMYADVGTTAEIYEVEEKGRIVNNILLKGIKAIGRQRFKLLETKQDPEGFPVGRVRILPEIVLSNPIDEISLQGQDCRVKGKIDAESAKKMFKSHSRDSVMSVWPSWVFEQYDSEHLVKRMMRVLSCHSLASKIPTDPVELSFWVARSLPLKDSVRLIPLRMNCAIQRLRWEILTLEKLSILCCHYCNQAIANQQDVFSMSAEGLQATYCNMNGYVYETITILKAVGLLLQVAEPSVEYSWFPGYAWTIAACSRCKMHMGWLFTATDPDTKPKQFWGLSRRSLIAKLKEEEK